MLGIVLRQEGFEPVFVRSGDQAIAAFHQAKPDLVLLDLMLPGKDGLEICRELRLESGVPIVMLTAKTDTVDVVLGLESGADDYITKPFSAKELVARIRARLRRRDTDGAETLRFHDIEMDVMAHQVTKDGKSVNLTPLEFELLATLARRPRQVFTREVLLEQVWGYRYAGDTRLVNVHVQRLRAKIERDPEHPEVVLTVDRKSTRLNSSHANISYAVFCLKKKKNHYTRSSMTSPKSLYRTYIKVLQGAPEQADLDNTLAVTSTVVSHMSCSFPIALCRQSV